MLVDPQVITLSEAALTLPRTAVTSDGAKYSSPDTTLKASVRHTYGRRNRHSVQLTFDKVAADPLLSSANRRLSMSTWILVDVPPEGFTIAEQVALVKALTTWLTANSMANTSKVVGGES